MATYTDNPNGFVCVDSRKPVFKARLATSQTIHKGDMLIPASGYLAIALSTSVVLAGIAIESVTSTTDTPWIEYVPALPGLRFMGQCSGTPTIATLWTYVDIEGTTGIMEVNEDASTYDVLIPYELWDKTKGYAANARLIFSIRLSPFVI